MLQLHMSARGLMALDIPSSPSDMGTAAHPVSIDCHQRLHAAGREGAQLKLRQQQRLLEHAARDGGPYLTRKPALKP